MATIRPLETNAPSARPSVPFNAAVSRRLDELIAELEHDDAPNPVRRAWLRLQKRYLESVYVPAFYPTARAVFVEPELLEEAV
jgi:hypothetical protein